VKRMECGIKIIAKRKEAMIPKDESLLIWAKEPIWCANCGDEIKKGDFFWLHCGKGKNFYTCSSSCDTAVRMDEEEYRGSKWAT